MQVLQKGSTGESVRQWQSFLWGIGYKSVVLTSLFDDVTTHATRDFQLKCKLKSDGMVGAQTIAAAIKYGFPVIVPAGYPKKPSFSYPSSAKVREMFGSFKYNVLAQGNIQITDGWGNANIIPVHIPQLSGIEGAPANCIIYFHRRGAKQLQALFAAWGRAGVLKYVKTWAGAFNPRMIRGSTTQLSNHAFGSAFDINAFWNGLGRTPAAIDKPGTVIPLVKIANDHGFFWGGHYNSRLDGMHFELAVIDAFPKQTFADLDDDEIDFQIPTIPAAIADPAVNPANVSFAAVSVTDENYQHGNISSEIPQFNLPELESLPPDNNQPAGDAPGAPPSATLNVEDYKPFCKRWGARIWTAFAGGNITQGFGLAVAAMKDLEHWYIYAAAAVVIFLITLFFVLLASVVLGVILWRNRTEISRYLTLKYDSLIDPGKKNLELFFEKK